MVFMWCAAIPVWAQQQNGAQVLVEAGVRHDDFVWTVSGLNNSPTVVSELEWRDLTAYQLRSKYQVTFGHLYAKTDFSYGWITSGVAQDSDFDLDYRFAEFSRSVHNADVGNTMDLSTAVGLKFSRNDSWIAPTIGYGGSYQNLTLGEGTGFVPIPVLEKVITYSFNPDSTYKASWVGPVAGVDAVLKSSGPISLFGSFSYQWAKFDSVANWRSRSDFEHPRSFIQVDDSALRRIIMAGAAYDVSDRTALSFSYRFQRFSAADGTQYFFLANGFVTKQPFNMVQSSSHTFSLGFVFSFPF